MKIGLIGDSGVGKTTLSTVLSSGNFETSPIYRPTVGCSINIIQQTHELQGQYFVELWDVGGNPRFFDARPVCYEKCDGYIFLWDSSMEATYHSLQQWLAEITKARRAEEAQWAVEYGMERTESALSNGSGAEGGSSSSCGAGSSGPTNVHSHSRVSQSAANFGIGAGLNGGNNGDTNGSSSSLNGKDENKASADSEFSVPLLIVGNKVDKLSRNDRVTLQTACAQQVFVSSRTEDGFDMNPFHKFFDEVYGKAIDRGASPGNRVRSHSIPALLPTLAMVHSSSSGGSNSIVPDMIMSTPDGKSGSRALSNPPHNTPYTPDASPQRDRDRRDGDAPGALFSISSLSFSSTLFSFSSPTGTSYLRYRAVGATVGSTDKEGGHRDSIHSVHLQEKV